MSRITVEEFRKQATEVELETLDKLMELFNNTEAYEEIEYIEDYKGDSVAEVFTTPGNLVTTVNLSRREYLVEPLESLCLVPWDLSNFTEWMRKGY